MLRSIVALMFFLIFPVQCAMGKCKELNKDTCDILQDFTLADTKQELHFKHPCSSLDNNNEHYQTAYAVFESTTNSLKALFLAEVFVGWLGFHPEAKPIESLEPDSLPLEAQGLGIDLEKAQIQGLSPWARAPFSIALQMQNERTKELITGGFSKTYFYSYEGSGYPEDKNYEISKSGSFDWERLKEPEDKSKSSRPNEYKGSEDIYINSPQITNLKDSYTLYLLLRNENTGETIKLQGPKISNLKELLDIEYSGPRVLNWEVLLPWQEGGLIDWMIDAFKYGDCIYLRKQAKKEFSLRWKQ